MMKCVILAGGLGTRLAEQTDLIPKPLVEIGGKPILWHIMKIYSHYGINEFIICCGYKGYLIKEYFANYSLHTSDVTFDMGSGQIEVHRKETEPWKVTLVDTGQSSLTGGRLLRVSDFLDPDESFCFTYGDGVADININKLVDFHEVHGKLATVTAVRSPGRYGALTLGDCNQVDDFSEKTEGERSWINGGFFVLNYQVLERISGDQSSWEGEPLFSLSLDKKLFAYKHEGFWQPMDTLREKNLLNELWDKGEAPWKKW
jgi:glucose-1-phosphate cytidylyltransferase